MAGQWRRRPTGTKRVRKRIYGTTKTAPLRRLALERLVPASASPAAASNAHGCERTQNQRQWQRSRRRGFLAMAMAIPSHRRRSLR